MSGWITVQAKPLEPVTDEPPPEPEFWQLNLQKEPATAFEGIVITCRWQGVGLPEGITMIELTWDGHQTIIARTPVGTVLHTFNEVGPLGGTVVVKIDLYGGLQAHLHYPTLSAPYRIDML